MQMSEYPWYITSFFYVGVAAITLFVGLLVALFVKAGIENFKTRR